MKFKEILLYIWDYLEGVHHSESKFFGLSG